MRVCGVLRVCVWVVGLGALAAGCRVRDACDTTCNLSGCDAVDGMKQDLSDADAAVIAAALTGTPKPEVHHVNLSWNRIGDDGAAALAGVLASNPHVRMLHLGQNEIGDAGAEALVAGLRGQAAIGGHVVTLYTAGNPMGKDAEAEVKKALDDNRKRIRGSHDEL